MRRNIHLAAVGMVLALPAAVRAQDAINLVCIGGGNMMTNVPTSSLEWDKFDHKYRVKNGFETTSRGFESAVTIQIQGDEGRIRLPKGLIPPLNSGGDHQHWWELKDIAVSDREIRAEYRLNGLNKPKIRIDRTTGMVSIKGTGQSFDGRCDRVDSGERRF